MPFQIIRADITKVKADAIVNTANPAVAIGDGVDSAIYNASGREKLLEERKKIGNLEPGEVGITPAFDLDAKYIIHASLSLTDQRILIGRMYLWLRAMQLVLQMIQS